MIRGAFDTDKLAFTELLGVPYAIWGRVGLTYASHQLVVAPVSYKESQMVIKNPHIESISGVKNLGR